MATAQEEPTSYSEEIFDYSCTVCSKRNVTKEAKKFCKECRKYFCESCLKQHSEYMDRHTLLDPGDPASFQTFVLPVEQCKTHNGRLLELFCGDHDMVVCNTCVSLEHRLCSTVKYIPSQADELIEGETLQEVNVRLEVTVKTLEECCNKNLEEKKKLVSEKNRQLSLIEDHQRKLVAKIVEMGETSKNEVKAMYKELEEKQVEKINEYNKLESDARACLKDLDAYTENKSQLFVTLKKGHDILRMADNLINTKLQDSTGNHEMKFLPNGDIDSYLAGLRSLGSFQIQRPHLYSVTQKQIKSVKIRSDKFDCNIFDTCFLTDGSLLLADLTNKRLKRLDGTSFSVTDCCDLPGMPYGLCCVCQHEVAVCLKENQVIQFVAVGKKMKLRKQIKVNYRCLGIAFSNNNLFVSSGDQKLVYVYNQSGEQVRTIGQTGQDMLTCSRFIAFNDCADRMYVTDKYNGVVCVDKHGREMYRYQGAQLDSGCGICTDDQMNLFVTGLESDNVVLLGKDGEELGEVLTQSDGLKKPCSVCFDKNNSRLIVSNFESGSIIVCDIVYKII